MGCDKLHQWGHCGAGGHIGAEWRFRGHHQPTDDQRRQSHSGHTRRHQQHLHGEEVVELKRRLLQMLADLTWTTFPGCREAGWDRETLSAGGGAGRTGSHRDAAEPWQWPGVQDGTCSYRKILWGKWHEANWPHYCITEFLQIWLEQFCFALIDLSSCFQGDLEGVKVNAAEETFDFDSPVQRHFEF